jgi:hypothetical protein
MGICHSQKKKDPQIVIGPIILEKMDREEYPLPPRKPSFDPRHKNVESMGS